jgi:carboxymethylenebutenolidase
MDTIATSTVELPAKDGTSLHAYVAQPKDLTPSRSILVFQEAFGVNGYIRGVTERLAQEGFYAIAPDLYYRISPDCEIPYTDFEQARPLMASLTTEQLETDIRAAAEWIQEEAKLELQPMHAIGFCMGGRVSFLANTILPLTSTVCFYGGNISNLLDRVDRLNGSTLFLWGGKDKRIDASERQQITQAMDQADKSYTATVFSQADHGFFCDQRSSYHAKSSTLAWPLTIGFLKQEA